MKTIGRLQFRHFSETFESRETAYKYLSDIVDITKGDDYRLDESRIGEPILVKYKDENGNIQALLSIGLEGEKDEGVLSPYHIIDSAKLEEEIQSISGSTDDIKHKLEEEITRAKKAEEALQSEIDATQTGAGLKGDGSYAPESTATYVSDATSLKDADTKLDEELARVEKARKDVTGQETDIYVPNQSLTERPIAYISDAESLNDADVKLDKAIQDLSSETVKNVVVDGVSGVVVDNLAVVSISGDSIPIGPYENYEGKAVKPHPIHDDYTVLDAIKQLDLNLLDFTEKQTETLNGLHVVKVTSGLDSNVREAYDLVNKNGLVQENSDRILIYKDSSLEKVYLGHVDDYLPDYSSPVYVSGTGDTALCFIYLTVNGAYQLVPINVESFLEESEFKDGLEVNNHEVKVKIAQTSEPFLTVDENGVKLSGIQNAINAAKAEEETRATTAENYISGQVKTLTNTVTAFSAATVGEVTRLDTKISDETTRATAAENSISGIVNTFSAVTEAFSAKTVAEIARLDEKIGAETVRAKAIEKSLQDELDATQNGAGLNGDGTYKGHDSQSEGMVYITTATSIDNATVLLDKGIQAEKTRAIAAEELISGDVTTLSASTIAFSAKTVAEISRVDEKIDDLSAATETFSAATVGEVTRLDTKINNETTRATAAENSISGAVDTFSAATEAFSAATVSEIARLDSQSARNKVKSAGKTILVNEATEGTNLEVNIDNKTILSNNGELKTGLKVIPVAPGKLEPNVREAFMLVDNEGTPVDNTIIKIYKSSSLVSVQLINVGGIDYVRITYIDNDGVTQIMDLNIQQLIFEAEFKDGLVVNENGEVRVKIDPTSEEFLTVSSEGVKVSHVQDAINTAVATEKTRATAAENSISGDVTTLSSTTKAFSAATVNEIARVDGRIDSSNTNLSELSASTKAFSAATVNEVARLDTKIGAETTRATDAENSISGDVTTLSSTTKSEITRLDEKIDAEATRAKAAEKTLQNELDATQNGAGLNGDGTYKGHDSQSEGMVYIATATSIDNATVLLDKALKAESDRAIAAENSISGIVNTFSAVTEAFSASTVSEIAKVNGRIDSSNTNLSELSASTETFSANTVSEIERLDRRIDTETGRATAAENSISGNVTTLSAETKAFSAKTVAEIARLDEKIGVEATRAKAAEESLQNELDKSQLGAGLNEDGTYKGHDSQSEGMAYITTATSIDNATVLLDKGIQAETARATAAENSISGAVDTFSAVTKAFSAATVSEIARLDAQSTRDKVKSAGNTIVVNEATEGTNLEVNIDNKTILSNNGELKTGLKVIPVAPDKLDSNVREAFMLVDNEGKPVDNTIIKIYKSSSLVSVQLIKIDNIDYVRITYIDNEGTTKTMDLNIQQLIFEAEFKDGLVVNENGEVRVKIDPTSEEFLTVSSEGVKVSGLKNAIDTSVAIETARATAAENSISGNVTTLSAETVAKFELMESGWNVLGSIKHTLEDTFVKSVAVGSAEDANKSLLRYYNDGDEHKYYASSNANDMYYDGIPLSTVIKNIKDEITQSGGDTNKFSAATVGEVARLDTKIGDETVRATAAENSISGTVNTFSAATKSEITRVDGKIDTETTRAEAAEKALQNELNKTQNGAGLNEDGSYTPHNTEGDMANYIKNATSLDEADIMLDSALKALKDSMTGSTADINELSGQVETFSAATKNAISNVQSELDTTQAGAGLNANGSYNRHNTTDDMANYITNANSLDEADVMLDSALKTESDRATAAENSISGNVTTLSAETKTLSAATVSEIIRVDGKIDAETARAKAAEKALQDELDKSQLGAGLNEDGSYHRHNTADDMANYIKNATSLDEADIMLDSALKAESNRAITAEDSISGTVNTFSAATESIIKDLQEKLTKANSTIESLRTELKTLSGAVETIESQIVDNVYTTVKAMLQGTSKQIKVTPDDANEKIAIGFADDATFGQQNNG